MGVGQNAFTYADDTREARAADHARMGRAVDDEAAAASASAVYPTDKGESAGSDIGLQVGPAVDPDGDKITDYQFELSNAPTLRLPLSMTSSS
jgi:hypothetical protein